MNYFAINIIILFILHFIGDFIFQSDWMAINKSKRLDALVLHCLIYTSCFLYRGPEFALAIFFAHLITDAISSRITSYFYPKNRHWFFVAIGADQLIHQITLIWLLCYLK